MADPSTPSSIPSEEGSPSSVALETPVCDDFPIVPSVQPLNSRAPRDDFYEFFYNPIWEPSDKSHLATPVSAPSSMASSDMGDASPMSSGPVVMSSIDTPIPATSPVISTPYTVTSSGQTVPRRYRSLRDARQFFSWGHDIVPTT